MVNRERQQGTGDVETEFKVFCIIDRNGLIEQEFKRDSKVNDPLLQLRRYEM